MADNNGRRPRLLDASGGAIRRDESDLVADVGLLHVQVSQLQGVARDLHETVKVHQTALTDLSAVVASLEARTLRGRIRRFVAWVEAERALWTEIIRDRLGIEPSPTVQQLLEMEQEQVRRGLEQSSTPEKP